MDHISKDEYDVVWCAPDCRLFSQMNQSHGRTKKRPLGTTPEAWTANTLVESEVRLLRKLR